MMHRPMNVTFQNSVHGASITPISQISTSTILIKLMAEN